MNCICSTAIASAPLWCKVVNSGVNRERVDRMAVHRQLGKPRIRAADTTRASVSFPSNIYEELERIAEVKKVSLAWVVREAAEKYVTDQWPLLVQTQGKS